MAKIPTSDKKIIDLDAEILATAPKSEYIRFEFRLSSSSNGGVMSAGVWNTRTINLLAQDDTGQASLATNQMTLPAGTYDCRAAAVHNDCGFALIRLQDVSNAATLIQGIMGAPTIDPTGENELAWAMGRFVLTAPTTLEVQHRIQAQPAEADVAQGEPRATSIGAGDNVYLTAEFWRVG